MHGHLLKRRAKANIFKTNKVVQGELFPLDHFVVGNGRKKLRTKFT